MDLDIIELSRKLLGKNSFAEKYEVLFWPC